jgi:hypothetical protein
MFSFKESQNIRLFDVLTGLSFSFLKRIYANLNLISEIVNVKHVKTTSVLFYLVKKMI